MNKEINCKLKGYIKPEVILNYIRKSIDENAEINIEKTYTGLIPKVKYEKYGDDDLYYEHGHISFNSKKGELKCLSYYYQNFNTSFDYLESGSYNEEEKERAKVETTDITFNYNKEVMEIMGNIVNEFGGWTL